MKNTAILRINLFTQKQNTIGISKCIASFTNEYKNSEEAIENVLNPKQIKEQ